MGSSKREVAAAVYPDPQTLYDKDEFHRESPLKFLLGPISGFGFGWTSHLFNNLIHDRPVWAGAHRIITYGVPGAICGYYIQKATAYYFGYRDQVYRHYVKLHPEEFPPPPKIKVADKWEPWLPNRFGNA